MHTYDSHKSAGRSSGNGAYTDIRSLANHAGAVCIDQNSQVAVIRPIHTGSADCTARTLSAVSHEGAAGGTQAIGDRGIPSLTIIAIETTPTREAFVNRLVAEDAASVLHIKTRLTGRAGSEAIAGCTVADESRT
jgi:hypothetical protein